uniref:EMI domain-containing protein n=1 Tax=Parascaris univalens TaxID=6257 RepID=A0A915CBY2_PARUN
MNMRHWMRFRRVSPVPRVGYLYCARKRPTRHLIVINNHHHNQGSLRIGKTKGKNLPNETIRS